MLKKSLIIVALSIISSTIFAQDVKKEAEVVKTKMEAFASKTGIITKFTDYKLPNLKTTYGGFSETRIRKVNSGSATTFFYQIEKAGKYSNSTASIEYSDLIEVIKALKSLKSEVNQDVTNNPDYLENKFTTVDGFKIGYFVNKGKASWYLQLEKYGSDNTIFIESGETLEIALDEAKSKIDELKKI